MLRYQLDIFNDKNDYLLLDNVILQTRKSLECIAYASISPNKKAYSKFRSEAEKSADFRKDYNGTKIIKQLSIINKDFYPLPLEEPNLTEERAWHFDRFDGCYLTKKQFITLYDRLGKYLHADNPWDNDKNYLNLAKDLSSYFVKIKSLLQVHVTFVQDQKSRSAFVIDMGSKVKDVSVITAVSSGDFLVNR